MTTTTRDNDKKPETKTKESKVDPMATPPDSVSSPSQMPSDLDPEAGKEKKEKEK